MSLVSRFARSRKSTRTRLGVEQLESREVPANLLPVNDFFTPNTKALYVPLSVTDTTGTVTYTATSTDPARCRSRWSPVGRPSSSTSPARTRPARPSPAT